MCVEKPKKDPGGCGLIKLFCRREWMTESRTKPDNYEKIKRVAEVE